MSPRIVPLLFAMAIELGAQATWAAAPAPPRITVLYDAFGQPSALAKDWGYAALVEYDGKRILFDTGNDPGVLARNARARSVDLAKLDFVVLSHRHADHMGGLTEVLRVNPRVPIYAPKEGFGVYGSDLPGTFFRKDPSLPEEQRYFDGKPPEVLRFGTAWPGARIQLVDKDTDVSSGIRLISLVSEKTGTLELRELSLVIDTPDGAVILVGCSHPGIDRILAAVAERSHRIRLVAGGLHWVTASDADIERAVLALRDTFKVQEIAPGHCTGEPGFAALRKAFGARYRYAGLGTTIDLPSP